MKKVINSKQFKRMTFVDGDVVEGLKPLYKCLKCKLGVLDIETHVCLSPRLLKEIANA